MCVCARVRVRVHARVRIPPTPFFPLESDILNQNVSNKTLQQSCVCIEFPTDQVL